MKIVHVTLIALTALGAGMTASYADAPDSRQQAEDLWIATGDASLARAAGLSDNQVQSIHRMPVDRTNLGE